jgi:hypothetical protein
MTETETDFSSLKIQIVFGSVKTLQREVEKNLSQQLIVIVQTLQSCWQILITIPLQSTAYQQN